MTENDTSGYIPIYPIRENVEAKIKLTDDSLTDDLIESSMRDADDKINGLLAAVPLPTYTIESSDIPEALVLAGNFFAACYIHRALQGTDDIATNPQEYCSDAKEIIDAYILGKKSSLDDDSLKERMNPYASSKSPSVFELGIRRR